MFNLPPWLVTKKFFVTLTLIIPCKELVKMYHMDVYLAPLIEELQVLWKGVVIYDVAKVETQKHFTLRAISLWMIHDFPSYGLLARCVLLGYKACPTRGLDLTSRHSFELGKVVYEGSHHWLLRGHLYQKNRNPTILMGKKNT
jgi:hypothetical protein